MRRAATRAEIQKIIRDEFALAKLNGISVGAGDASVPEVTYTGEAAPEVARDRGIAAVYKGAIRDAAVAVASSFVDSVQERTNRISKRQFADEWLTDAFEAGFDNVDDYRVWCALNSLTEVNRSDRVFLNELERRVFLRRSRELRTAAAQHLSTSPDTPAGEQQANPTASTPQQSNTQAAVPPEVPAVDPNTAGTGDGS